MFITALNTTPLGVSLDDRVIWEQRHNPLIWEDEDYIIEIKIRFQSDFASVPRLPLIYAWWGDRAHHEAALHDYNYRKDCRYRDKRLGKWVIGMPRPQADALFRKSILIRGYGGNIAYPMWAGVRLGGWTAYQKLTVDHQFQLKIIYPESLT